MTPQAPCPQCGTAVPLTVPKCPRCGTAQGGKALLAQPPVETVGALALLLLMGACLCAGVSLLFMSQATFGVGIMALACFLAICARIAQAARHRKDYGAPR